MRVTGRLTNWLRFYVPCDTKSVISETFLSAILLAQYLVYRGHRRTLVFLPRIISLFPYNVRNGVKYSTPKCSSFHASKSLYRPETQREDRHDRSTAPDHRTWSVPCRVYHSLNVAQQQTEHHHCCHGNSSSNSVIKGVFNYRIRIQIHTESRFRFSEKKCIRITNPNLDSDSVKQACNCKSISTECLIIETGSRSVKWHRKHVIKLSQKHTNCNVYCQKQRLDSTDKK